LSCRPDVNGREKILKVHVRNVPLAPNVDLKVLGPRHARVLRCRPDEPGQRGCAARLHGAVKRLVTMAEFEDAKDKVMMGAERRSTAMTEEEKKLTAYHEAGHAIVALQRAGCRPGSQGDDHSARPCAGHGDAASRGRSLLDELQANGFAPRHHDGWSRCGGGLTFGKKTSPPALRPTSSRQPSWPARW
jgi:SpoVK/Ycf46/Vps4 family AAA+-type ATPase